MLINQKQQNKGLFYGRGKYTLWILLGIFSLIIILGDFLSMNNIFFEIVKNCSVYVNSYSDLFSISRNLLGVYPVLLLEFAAGIVLTIVGLSYYGK